MNTIDYSKNDIFDVNNRLFRMARNNISALNESINELDDDEQQNAENNLLIYGSELINNLNQINYTFKQLEDYMFIPSKITKKNIKKVIDNGENMKVEDIKEPTPVLPNVVVNEELPQEEEPIPALVEDIPEIVEKQITSEDVSEEMKSLIGELEKVNSEFQNLLDQGDDINNPSEELQNLDKISSEISSKLDKLAKLKMELVQKEMEQQKQEENGPAEEVSIGISPSKKSSKVDSIVFPEAGQFKQELKEIRKIFKDKELDSKQKVEKAKLELEKLGFSQLDNLNSINSIKEAIKKYEELPLQGSGRFKGGVKIAKKSSKVGQKVAKVAKTKQPKAKKQKNPLVGENVEEFDYVDDNDVEEQQKSNLGDAQKLNNSLVSAINTSQRTPIPTYISKIYELMTNLIQFIGKTTVLYISRIKKNLNYLTEEQVKLIYEAIGKFKGNLAILSQYKNKGGAIIKDTLYSQVEKETLGLYNEIYNSIRNYSKLKDYTTFAGSGMSHNNLVGGYFIQSDNPFIMHSTTKRFL